MDNFIANARTANAGTANDTAAKTALIASIRRPGGQGGFFRLITNPQFYEEQVGRGGGNSVQSVNDRGFVAVKEYAERVLLGAEGKPYCPFVKAIHANNSYVVREYHTGADSVDFRGIFGALAAGFKSISTFYKNAPVAKADLTIVIGAFCGPGCGTPQFHFKLDQAHAKAKEAVRGMGLMIGIMGPHHPLGGREGGNEPMFICDVPIVVIRRMHPTDHTFMSSEQSKNSYRQYYGERLGT